MNLLLKNAFIPIISVLLVNCASSTKTDSMSNDDYKQSIEGKIGTPVSYISNEANDKILCVKEDDNSDETKVNRVFVVWDIENSKIVYEKNMKGGYVKWFDNDHLEITGVIGIVQPGKEKEDYVQIVNVLTNQSMSKSSFLKSRDL